MLNLKKILYLKEKNAKRNNNMMLINVDNYPKYLK